MMSARFSAGFSALGLVASLGCGSETTGAGDVLAVASVEISPPELALVAGTTAQLNATPKTSSGIAVPNRQATWSTDDPGIATVSDQGLVSAVGAGATRINARVDGVSASIPVDVSPKGVATVTLAPSQVSLLVGETRNLTVTARSQDGETLPGRPATFVSDNPEIATVSDAGQVTAVGPGLTVITATVEGKSGTANVAVNALPATQLEFQNQPGTGAAGSPIPPVRVEVQNSQGGTVSQGSVAVTVALAYNPTGATLSGTLTVGASNGVATFSDLRVNQAGTGYTLRATAGALTPAESAPFAIVAGSAARLAIATQPSSNATSGVALTVQPRIQIRDADGNAVASGGVQVTAVLEGSGATLSGTRTVSTNADGLATFTNLTLSGVAATYTLLFAAPGLTAIASNGITLSAGAPARLVLTRQPSPTAQAGVALDRQPEVQLEDADGNPASQAGIAVTAAIQSGGGVLEGSLTVLTDSEGRAAFGNLAIGGATGVRVLRFTAGSLTAAFSEEVVVVPGPARALVITTQPPATRSSGEVLSPSPVIRVVDEFNNAVDPDPEISISAAIASGSGGSLSGTTTVSTSAGVATFSGLVLNGPPGEFTLRFSGGGLQPVVSNPITLSAAGPTALFIATQPSTSAPSGVVFDRQPVIQLRDASGNNVAQSGIEITVAIASGGGTLGGDATQTTDTDGRATFTDLSITGTPGERTLRFTATGLSDVTSNAIDITAAPASSLTINTQPSTTAVSGEALVQQPVLLLQNSTGDPVSGSTITATINSGPSGSTLANATAVTSSSGIATFSGLAITGGPGEYTLKFAAGSVSVVSATVTINANATGLVLATPPSSSATSGSAFATQPAVQLVDGNGDPVAQGGITITAVIATGPAGASLANATATTGPSGLATFSGLAITGEVGTYTLRFQSGSLDPVTSASIDLSAGAASTLAIVTQPPPSTVNGAEMSSSVVDLQDAGGNGIGGVAITATRASGSGELDGTLTRTTASTGRATFDDLTLTGLVGTYTIRYSAPGGISAVSSAITLTPGLDVALAIITQPPATAKSDKNISPAPRIELRDGSGNTVTRSGVVISAELVTESGSGELGGSVQRSTDTGIATFNNLRIKGSGVFRLRFTSPDHSPVTSTNIAVEP